MNPPANVKQAIQALTQTIKPAITPQTGAGLVPTKTTTTGTTTQASSQAPKQSL